jgi:putative phosphoesterase
MKIGVLSDTHIISTLDGQQLAERLMSGVFADVDAILHAGDHVYQDLGLCFAPVDWYAVRGNLDQALVNVPAKRIMNFSGKRIGMIHGWGRGSDIVSNVLASFADTMPDVLIFGHSHQPECRWVGSTLLLNPGSPTDPRSARIPTVGMLTLGDTIVGEIINLT